MSININNEIASIADISIKVYPSRLSKRQQTALAKQVRTGVVSGNGVPAQLARQILEAAGAPYLHLMNYGYIQWFNVPLDPAHPLREALLTAHATSCMHPRFEDRPHWQQTYGIPSVGDRVRKMDTCRDWTSLVKSARDAACKTASAEHKIEIPAVIDWRV